MAATRLMLGRRPKVGQQAFGHVQLNSDAQTAVEHIVAEMLRKALSLTVVKYDPDDIPSSGEVMTHALAGIDSEFQQAAAWSLERTVKEITRGGRRTNIGRSEIDHGRWTFYALHATVDGSGVTVVRGTSPTRALKHDGKWIAQFTGGELKPIRQPLIGIDYKAEAVVADGTVYIFAPQALERLLIDADEIKSRASQISARFESGLAAKLSVTTATCIETACSKNSIVGRRVERMNRTANLASMTEAKLREGLKDAHLPPKTFGAAGKPIDITSLDDAHVLIDIAADLYYQPRFEQTGRRVAAFRRLV
jgi:hypothetical protein